MKTGKINIQGNILGDCWEKIYETTLTEAATSVTISNLDGNTDEEYQLICRFVGDGINNYAFYLRPNNDSGENYGAQEINGINSTISASRPVYTYFHLGSVDTNKICFTKSILCAKSGYVRTILNTNILKIDATTISQIIMFGQVWNNTADDITSLIILAQQASGLGIGTQIELYKRSKKI